MPRVSGRRRHLSDWASSRLAATVEKVRVKTGSTSPTHGSYRRQGVEKPERRCRLAAGVLLPQQKPFSRMVSRMVSNYWFIYYISEQMKQSIDTVQIGGIEIFCKAAMRSG
jgi:hypothetical protein